MPLQLMPRYQAPGEIYLFRKKYLSGSPKAAREYPLAAVRFQSSFLSPGKSASSTSSEMSCPGDETTY